MGAQWIDTLGDQDTLSFGPRVYVLGPVEIISTVVMCSHASFSSLSSTCDTAF